MFHVKQWQRICLTPLLRRAQPARFCRSKNGAHFRTVRTVKPSGFAKQTEKGENESGASLLASVFVSPFSTNCRDKNAANSRIDWFFVTFLTQESNVSPVNHFFSTICSMSFTIMPAPISPRTLVSG